MVVVAAPPPAKRGLSFRDAAEQPALDQQRASLDDRLSPLPLDRRHEPPDEDDEPSPPRRSSLRNRRKSSIHLNRGHLRSEVSNSDIVEHINLLQSQGIAFTNFTQDDIGCLAEALSVNRFECGHTVVEKGETGSWFGVLLSGTLRVILPQDTITIQPGALLGEMAVWKDDNVRVASMEGGEPGLIATMLRTELPQFVGECPHVGVKLMGMMAEGTLAKHTDNLRRERGARMVHSIA